MTEEEEEEPSLGHGPNSNACGARQQISSRDVLLRVPIFCCCRAFAALSALLNCLTGLAGIHTIHPTDSLYTATKRRGGARRACIPPTPPLLACSLHNDTTEPPGPRLLLVVLVGVPQGATMGGRSSSLLGESLRALQGMQPQGLTGRLIREGGGMHSHARQRRTEHTDTRRGVGQSVSQSVSGTGAEAATPQLLLLLASCSPPPL